MFSLESPHRGDSNDEAILMSTQNIPFSILTKKITLLYTKSVTMELFPRDSKTSSKEPW